MPNLWKIWLAKCVIIAAAVGKEAINSLQGNKQVVEMAVKRMKGHLETKYPAIAVNLGYLTILFAA